MIYGRVLIFRLGFLGFKVNGQIAIHNRRMLRQVPDVTAGDRINGVHQMIRLMQPVTLFLIACQRTGVHWVPVR